MTNEATGHPLIKYFQKCSLERGKIYLNSANEDQIANNIDAHFANGRGIEFGRKCIAYYFDNHDDLAITLQDFVMKLSDIIFAVQALEDDKEKTARIMQKTKERMEGLS